VKWFETIVKPLISWSRRIWIELVNNVTRASFWSRIPIISERLAFGFIQDVWNEDMVAWKAQKVSADRETLSHKHAWLAILSVLPRFTYHVTLHAWSTLIVSDFIRHKLRKPRISSFQNPYFQSSDDQSCFNRYLARYSFWDRPSR